MRRAPGMAIAALATALLVAMPARAENGYEAQYLAESNNDVKLETGETTTSWFRARNKGSKVWSRSFVRLGTTNPRDRVSEFANSTWISVRRATPLDQPSVAPGDIGTFTFTVTAPPVPAVKPYTEYFAPVAEVRGWMENTCDPTGWCTNGVWLRYTVYPPRPPKVSITSIPSRVLSGSAIPVSVAASDNVRVNRVEIGLGPGLPVVLRAKPYQAQLGTAGLAPGNYNVTATAVDGAGHRTTTTRVVTIDPVANGAGATRDARLTAGFGRKLRSRRTVGFGKRAVVHGRLTTGAGAPIAGAALQIFTRVTSPRRHYRLISAPAMTGADGRYRYVAPKGPSRNIFVSYTAFGGDPVPAVRRLVHLRTRASLAFRANRRVVGPGGSVRFRGQLRGGPRPRGLLVVLRAHQRGFGWRTFKTVRTRRHGRFSAHYRFVTARHATLRFRAVMRLQSAYPYSTGHSRSISVRVR